MKVESVILEKKATVSFQECRNLSGCFPGKSDIPADITGRDGSFISSGETFGWIFIKLHSQELNDVLMW